MTTQHSQEEAVFLRSEANRVNLSINSSVRMQSQNPRVFKQGAAEGSENKEERTYDKSFSLLMVNVSRAVKDDR